MVDSLPLSSYGSVADGPAAVSQYSNGLPTANNTHQPKPTWSTAQRVAGSIVAGACVRVRVLMKKEFIFIYIYQ